MTKNLLDTLRARAKAVRTRAAVRRWNFRQRHLAAGVWFRLRRVLADAGTAYVIDDADARRLIAEGYPAEACGAELSPPKIIVFVEESRLSRIGRRPIPVGLGRDFMAASSIALVRFDVRS